MTRNTALAAAFAVATLCLLPIRHGSAEQTLRYSGSAQGGLSVTGNTLGLSGGDGTNGPTLNGSIATFIADDPESIDGTFPAGTTDDWAHARSEAWLDLPPDATVLYAELVWGGSWAGGLEDVFEFIDDPVLFWTPAGTVEVTPDESTGVSLDLVSASAFRVRYYVRTANVTAAIREGGSGMYTAGRVAATQDALVRELNAAGWTLLVAYHSAYEQGRNLSIFVGADWVDEEATLDTTVSGFCTPPSGEVLGRVHVSAMEGDAHFTGDSLLIGNGGDFSPLEGPFNPQDNFFGSQLNDGDGTRDTRGSFGAANHDPVAGTNVAGGRQSWDITAVPVSSTDGHLDNGQTEAVVRAATEGDSFVVTAVGFAIDVNAPEFDPTGAVTLDPEVAAIGDTISVTIRIANAGAADAEDVVVYVPLPDELSLVFGSVLIDGAADEPVTAEDLETGISIGDVPIDDEVVITFDVTLDEVPDGDPRLLLQPVWDYSWRTCPAEPPVSARAYAPVAGLDTGILQLRLDPDPAAGSLVGPYDVIDYVVEVSNSGSGPVYGATLSAALSDGLVYVDGTARVNGTVIAGASPLETPVVLSSVGGDPGEIAAGATVVVDATFAVAPDARAEVAFTAALDPDGDGPTAAVSTTVRHPIDADVDGDTVPNIAEDIDGDGELSDDDTDEDGLPNFADDDDDDDTVPTVEDNCPLVENPLQEDLDGDGIGDACDNDRDGDGLDNDDDPCPDDDDTDATDSDRDGTPDVCDETPTGGADDVGGSDVRDRFPDVEEDEDSETNSVAGCCAIGGPAGGRSLPTMVVAALALCGIRRRRTRR